MFQRIADFFEWFDARKTAHSYAVRLSALDQLSGWRIETDSGCLRHKSGRFFSVEGLAVSTNCGPVSSWSQPIIVQPECGILGIIMKRFHGIPHFLMQAKMEPGNIQLIELSPTVQATWSNYSGIHGGRPVPYLELFLAPRRARMISDVLQSEQGSWFLHKRNRNMVIEVFDDVEVLDGFCWLNHSQLSELMRWDHVVNMDSRTVLAGIPASETVRSVDDELDRDEFADVLSWFTEAKLRRQLTRERVALNDVKGWVFSPEQVAHESGDFFSVIGVDVEAGSREVAGWSQPMIRPSHTGVVAFLVRHVDGALHLLVRAHGQAGTLDNVEMAPTVQCAPQNYNSTERDRPAFLDDVLDAPSCRILFDAVHSEEGGRFYRAVNRYVVVEAGPEVRDEPDPDFKWVTLAQLSELVRHSNYVNVEARNLLACLLFL